MIVNGVWLFNEELESPNAVFDQKIPFSINNSDDSYTAMEVVEDSANNNRKLLRYVKTHPINLTKTMYNWDNPGWGDREEFRSISFGPDYKVVSIEFYQWLTANATRLSSGIRYGNDKILWGCFVIDTSRNPVTNGLTSDVYVPDLTNTHGDHTGYFIDIEYESELGYYVESVWNGGLPVCRNGEWKIEGAEYSNPVFEPTVVPAQFYDWFLANAHRTNVAPLSL